MSLPEILKSGERARLFPVLSDSSKEGRTLSIFMSCLANVSEFGQSLLLTTGQKVGSSAKVDTFTEVTFSNKNADQALRPDGLIQLRVGNRTWLALVEAKVGSNDIDNVQLENYLRLAKIIGADAVITISNQFAPSTGHHPVSVSKTLTKGVELFHWSWMSILTQGLLLLENGSIGSKDQTIILQEMVRFFSHESSGLKSFEQMPSEWIELNEAIRAGAPIPKSSPLIPSVINGWHQESRDLSLIMSRILGRFVSQKIPRRHRLSAPERYQHDATALINQKQLQTELDIPNAASSLSILVDLPMRSIHVSMRLSAPGDRQSSKARINWLLRQLAKVDRQDIFIRAIWQGNYQTQSQLAAARDDPEVLILADKKVPLRYFEIILVRELGSRFASRKPFIKELETAVPDFYELVGQHLKAWQAGPPKVRDDRKNAEDVETSKISADADATENFLPPGTNHRPSD